MRGSFSSTSLVLALGTAGRGEPADETDDGFPVQFLESGPSTDQRWNGEMFLVRFAVCDSMDASTSHMQTCASAFGGMDTLVRGNERSGSRRSRISSSAQGR